MRYGKYSFYADLDAIDQANKVLEKESLNIDTAFNLLLSDIINGKRMPVFSTEGPAEETPAEPEAGQKRGYKRITAEMREAVWNRYWQADESTELDNLGPNEKTSKLARDITEDTGMNLRSAGIYLDVIDSLRKGTGVYRQIKLEDFKYFTEEFFKRYGNDAKELVRRTIDSSKGWSDSYKSEVIQLLDDLSG